MFEVDMSIKTEENDYSKKSENNTNAIIQWLVEKISPVTLFYFLNASVTITLSSNKESLIENSCTERGHDRNNIVINAQREKVFGKEG